MRPSTLAELAHRHGVAVPPVPEGGFSGFRQFADRNSVVRSCLREPEDFARVAREFCADEAADGVRYAEATFSASSHAERLGAPGMPLAAVVAGLADGSAEHGIVVRLILDHSRRKPIARLVATVEAALAYPDVVVAVGVAGDEAYPLAPFAGVLAQARAAGLRMVHHAGEMRGPDSVVEALRIGAADRIGHGIQAARDPGVLAELRERGVGLEVCPSSNIALGLVGSWEAHPLPRLLAAGVSVSVNTDVPDVATTSLSGELARARTRFGWSDEMLARVAAEAVATSFAPAAVKARVAAEMALWWG